MGKHNQAGYKEVYKKIIEENKRRDAIESVFNSLGSGIDKCLDLLLRHGENNLNRTFSKEEADELLKKFK